MREGFMMKSLVSVTILLLTISCAVNDKKVSVGLTDSELTANDVKEIYFQVGYGNGWTCETTYKSDLSVDGGHMSGGKFPVLHIVNNSPARTSWSSGNKWTSLPTAPQNGAA